MCVEIHGHTGSFLVFLHIFRFSDNITLYRLGVNNLNPGIAHSTTLSLTVSNVKQYMAVFTGRECVTLITHTSGGCQFCLHAIILQNHAIIAGTGHFVRFLERTSPTFIGIFKQARLCLGFTGNGHQGDTTHLKLVETRKTVYAGVSIFVSDSFPTVLVSVGSVGTGSKFCQSKWFRGWRIDKPTAVHRTQIRIHIIQNIFLLPVA